MDIYFEYLILIQQGTRHANCLVSKVNQIRSWKIKIKMDVSAAITDAIKEFSISVQEIKKLKIKTTKKITSQMLQSEKERKEMVLQNQLQIVTIFAKVLKPKKGGGLSI
jgi:uncharacterized protein YoxC